MDVQFPKVDFILIWTEYKLWAKSDFLESIKRTYYLLK